MAAEASRRLRQPEVVGEIIAGIILGPSLLGWIGESATLEVFAELGVIFLLFAVGLESRVSDMLRVGGTAMTVAILGVVIPFGFGLALMLGLEQDTTAALFVATAMVATSVGITARVLSDLGQATSRPARVILGAAVIDDILGLIVLAIVSGLSEGGFSYAQIAIIVVEAIAFTIFIVTVGQRAAHRISAHLYRLRIFNPAFVISVTICLGLSAVAAYIGLAAIVGAFFAGMAFAETREAGHIRRSLDGVYALLVPVFFVIMGTKVELSYLFRPEVLILGLIVTLFAIAGKMIGCGMAALRLGKREALAVGIGMSPRGEVGIVVAAIGLSRGIITSDIYAIVIFMSILTSLIAPPFLRLLMARPPETPESAESGEPAEAGKPVEAAKSSEAE
ncbi:MAG: cation:proton antiporter [Armatimonadetes bacterium]|nr:cation:proton antiporter [Armatimonadota bacterium]NIM23276.1 cation:proton antiporter [Armatimonadota bacterium]NIM67144.1 cation:proton antiporter [Armatimonadota bacterium]NIM75670.1 cation:proton antiporter [Armatimonadota bacterium]NIN05333.1 cation:proton antiporter [Armatimonadota bacterium]